MAPDSKQFNVYLPVDLIKAVKRAALEADQSLSRFVEECLRNRVDGGQR
jgi:predicted HicB family RNase H-like nuclease